MPQSASPTNDVDLDVDTEAQDMASALGFSSFGTQEQNRPSKKRRFDATSDSSSQAPSPSGANSLPVHSRVMTSSANSSATQKDPAPVYLPGLEGLKMSVTSSSPGGVRSEGWYPSPENPDHRVEEVEAPIDVSHFHHGHRIATTARHKAARPLSSINPLWYVDYYDPSSNQNPWERLEQAKGLASIGSWLPTVPGQRSGQGPSRA